MANAAMIGPSLAILVLIGIVAVSIDRGFWNTVDRIALGLHRTAVRARMRQSVVAAELDAHWRSEVRG